jgi:hypothetical protein
VEREETGVGNASVNIFPRQPVQCLWLSKFLTYMSRTQAEVILNHVNSNMHGIEDEEARHRNYKRLKLGGGQAYDRSANIIRLRIVAYVKA